MVSLIELKKLRKRKKRLSIYTDEEKEFCEKLIETIKEIYFVGIDDKMLLEEKLLKVIRGRNV